MFTLDGRMRFRADLNEEGELAFHQRKLLEIVLSRKSSQFELQFVFAPLDETGIEGPKASKHHPRPGPAASAEMAVRQGCVERAAAALPDYLQLEEAS